MTLTIAAVVLAFMAGFALALHLVGYGVRGGLRQIVLRRSALESFDGCPHRFNVLYNLCLCGHTRQDHTDGTGECCGQVKRKGLVAVDAGPLPRHVPCDCEAFRPVEDKGDESQRGIAFHEIAFRYIDRLARLGLETDRFTWIPDLVYVYPNRVTIKDWKTYYKGLTPDQARSEFQLKFYLLQAKDIWPGFEEYEFVFVFVRLGYEVSVVLRPDDIEAFRPEVEAITLAMAEAARTGNFPAIQGSHCGLCRLKCPLADNPMKLPARFQTTEQAQQAFGRLLTLEQEVKALKKGLAAWCMTEGPLHYRGQEYLHKSSTSRRYPAAAVIDFLRERGTDKSLIEAITISHSALGDFGKPKRSSPAILEHLADIEQATTKWAFRHRKAGELAPAGYVDALEGDDDDSDE
jgi:hypothetical protein